MIIINPLSKISLVLALSTILLSCGMESSSLPPQRPAGHIEGHAIDSAIAGATVSVYSFANGARGDRLGSAQTDTTGAFSITVQAESQLVLVEVTGGSYREEASGVEVRLADGQSLRSLVHYESGLTVSTNVTPLTHIATALAEYKIHQGAAPAQAMNDAFGEIDNFFALNTRGVTSINISNDNPTLNTVDSEVLYGFYLAGLSSWTAWINKENNRNVHTAYTSVELAKYMYEDIMYDGLLDGRASNNNGSGSVDLTLENVTLNADAYRLAFSLHMIAMASGTQNKTGIDPQNEALIAAAQAIAAAGEQSSLFPAGTGPLELVDSGFTVSVDPSQYNGLYGRNYRFNIDVQSLLGAERIEIRIDSTSGDPVQTLLSQEAPVANLDLSQQVSSANCQHQVHINAVNILGNVAATSFSACFDWDLPTLTFSTAPYTNSSQYTLGGEFGDDQAGVQSITVIMGNAEFPAMLTPGGSGTTAGTWSVDLQGLAPAENSLQVSVTDIVGNQFIAAYSVYLDDRAPQITIGTHGQARFSDGSGGYFTDPLASVDIHNPLYIETNLTEYTGASNNPGAMQINNIPFYRFTVSDERAPSVNSEAQILRVEIRYEKVSGEQTVLMEDWRVVGDSSSDGYRVCDAQGDSCEYYLPLASPLLVNNWDQTTPQETHILNVRVSDTANNQTSEQFRFLADIYVPRVCATSTCSAAELAVSDLEPFGVGFANRAQLLETTLATTRYTFRNPSRESIYLHLDEATVHSVTQQQEQEQRVHVARKTTSTAWQARVMNPITAGGECPIPGDTIYNVGSSNSEVSILNWTGSSWTEVPPPLDSSEQLRLTSDSLPDTALVVEPVPDTDLNFNHISATVGDFQYDYDQDFRVVRNSNSGILGYASIPNWQSTDLGNQNTITCNDLKTLTRTVTENYSTVEAPRDVVSTVEPAISRSLYTDTAAYFVTADGIAVESTNGWYLIPGGAQVVVTKNISTDTTPDIVLQDADFSANASYTIPSIRDVSFTWRIDRSLTLTTIHNVGADNIGLMPQRETSSATGFREYTLSR